MPAEDLVVGLVLAARGERQRRLLSLIQPISARPGEPEMIAEAAASFGAGPSA